METTTIKQSKALLKAGIDKSSADVCWTYTKFFDYELTVGNSSFNNPMCVPAWTLSALLSLIPDDYSLDRIKDGRNVSYELTTEIDEHIYSHSAKTPVEAAVLLLVEIAHFLRTSE